MKKAVLILSALVSLAALPMARADILPPGPGGGYPWLPPDTGYDLVNHTGGYASPQAYHVLYDNVVRLDSVFHYGFLQSFLPPASGTAIHTFGSSLELIGSVNLGGTWAPISMAGVPNTTTVGITVDSPGSYSTEMTALNVAANTPYGTMMIRESPTLHSTGHTTFTPVGSDYRIDSFFDIFTELSLDGGMTWIPGDSSTRVVYLCPEPASTALLGIGLAAFLLRYRRNRKG